MSTKFKLHFSGKYKWVESRNVYLLMYYNYYNAVEELIKTVKM